MRMGRTTDQDARSGIACLISFLAVVLPTGAATAQPFSMDDSLRDGSASGAAVGGSFGPDGWTVTSRTDRLWWALPRLVEGSVEFTVTGMSNANLLVNDNEIFALYEAGYGIAEPISYNPEFRNNHYKGMIRIYGEAETGRPGLQKLMFGLCPSGAPGYDTCGCESFFEEPFGGDGAWDGSPERLRVEWAGGITRLLRNGVAVVSIDWSASGLDFGPQELHMSLGSARADAVDTAGMPIGAVFSDVHVEGFEGPLAVCPGTAADADADADSSAEADAEADADADADADEDAPGDPGAEGEPDAIIDAPGEGDAPPPACRAVACQSACVAGGHSGGVCRGDLCVCDGGTSDGDGGCGCRVPAGGAGGVVTLLFAVVVPALRRRRDGKVG